MPTWCENNSDLIDGFVYRFEQDVAGKLYDLFTDLFLHRFIF